MYNHVHLTIWLAITLEVKSPKLEGCINKRRFYFSFCLSWKGDSLAYLPELLNNIEKKITLNHGDKTGPN